MSPTASKATSNLKVTTFIKPFTPDRPTHPYVLDKELALLIKSVDDQQFYSGRQVSIKECQNGFWHPVASRFNDRWYVSTGVFKG